MSKPSKVMDALRARGVADHVLAGGLVGVVAKWEKTASELSIGYRGNYHEWLNDMDGRDILQLAMTVASEDEMRAVGRRVRLADESVHAHTKSAGKCIWGTENAAKHGWNAGKQWWYFLEPKVKSAEFARDLAAQD